MTVIFGEHANVLLEVAQVNDLTRILFSFFCQKFSLQTKYLQIQKITKQLSCKKSLPKYYKEKVLNFVLFLFFHVCCSKMSSFWLLADINKQLTSEDIRVVFLICHKTFVVTMYSRKKRSNSVVWKFV